MTNIPHKYDAAGTRSNHWFSRVEQWISGVHPVVYVVAAALLLLPAFSSSFVQYQVFGWVFIMGMIGLSLMFLAGYGGMVSLAQMTVAAVAAYAVALLGPSGSPISADLAWWLYIPIAIAAATLFGTLVGAVSVRTQGIYTIMITLAIAAAFFYFANQNQELLNGSRGFNGVQPPPLFGIDWRGPTAFYYLTLGVATLTFLLVLYVSRSPFGLALQGVRDNPRRMAALGFNVTAHRVLAYTFSSFIAAVAGVLLVWFNGQISPGTAAVGPAIDVLVVAVVGGMRHPIGPFIGALIYVLLRTFAIDVFSLLGIASLRFNLLIGLGFLVIVLFSPDGILGLWRRWAHVLVGPASAQLQKLREPKQ